MDEEKEIKYLDHLENALTSLIADESFLRVDTEVTKGLINTLRAVYAAKSEIKIRDLIANGR